MKHIFLITVLLFSYSGRCQESDLKERNTISSKIIGKVFIDKEFIEVEGLRHFKKITDTSFSKKKTFKEYGIKHVRKEQTHILLLLDRLRNNYGKRTGRSKLLNYLELNLLESEGIVLGYCGENDNWEMDRIYAVVFDIHKAKKTKDFLSTIITIWKIDEENGFQKINLNTNFNCLSDTDYLIELAKL